MAHDAALEHVVLAVEEVGRVARVARDIGLKPGRPAKTRAPSTPSRRRPDPARPTRSRPRDAMPTGVGAQWRKSKLPCFGETGRPTGSASLHRYRRRPRGGTRPRWAGARRASAHRPAPRPGSRRRPSATCIEREQVEERAIDPRAVRVSAPTPPDARGRRPRAIPSPRRLHSSASPVAAVLDEGAELRVRHRRRVDAEGGDVDSRARRTRCPSRRAARRCAAPSVAVPAGTSTRPAGRPGPST